ncbi:hypothetical protein Ais01nite_57430 [Asanoa ishikariensis]|uniref:CHAT domain-containing protein n=1 Tax=Asanoa ishikariensis TaxID=137265 RepID=A0A1H3U1A8_9ACTN|nr:DUF6642 family protein [Asanoa ishikariensis]GIF67708.1 hypothetical protein Ais01nite_57430 [Asanoa ishikariensis]SDZ55279.1 hypothetical protein SAMN05421684_6605 [Asanoa ishikariensis]
MYGIFCVEGQWHRSLTDKSSVLPTLDMLNRLKRCAYIHKDVATAEELRYFLTRWTEQRYASFRVGHFAMHGEAKQLFVNDRIRVGLDEIAETLEGRCEGRRLYFGSCSVLRAPDAILEDFLHTTGAAMLCGYTREVDWVESAAFELVLLDHLANGERVDAAERTMRSRRWAPLAEHLGFRIMYANGRAA